MSGIQPAAGDAGGSLGAAFLALWYMHLEKKRVPSKNDIMRGSYLGPAYSKKFIKMNYKNLVQIINF